MKLTKDNRVFTTEAEDVICAFKEAGWVEAEEKKEAPKPVKKAKKEE